MHASFNMATPGPMPERRLAPRVKVTVPLEIRPEGSQVPIRASTSDLSVGGCYVEMMFTLEVNRKLEVVFWLGDTKIQTLARVATCHPQFGNGIQFLGMKSDDAALLHAFLDSVEQSGN